MKRFLIVVALVCALAGRAMAGDIHTVDSQAPAPSPSVATSQTTSPGDIPNTDCESPTIAESDLVGVLLGILGAL